jgi:hypothetical protein
MTLEVMIAQAVPDTAVLQARRASGYAVPHAHSYRTNRRDKKGDEPLPVRRLDHRLPCDGRINA